MILTIFQVPLTPYLPAISVFVNIFLMMRLSEATWVRFAVWMAIGLYLFLLPFTYIPNDPTCIIELIRKIPIF